MFVSPVDKIKNPGKKAWENFTIFDNGKFYAFFGTGHGSQSNPRGRAIGIDIAVSDDGVHWRFMARDLVPIPGAHAGFGVIRIGNKYMYYPTCSSKEEDVHFKIYQSEDLLHWEHIGDRYDVAPDRRYYRERWDEIYIVKEREEGREVYLGYISSEVRDDVGPPSIGMIKSYDGLSWEVLPPPVIDWGELPSQHMEVNFCERIGGKYYLSMSGRLYLDSYGYSLFTFVGESPYGPFKPDLPMFRLAGTSRHDTTWLGHTIQTSDGFLMALWLSYQKERDLPSDNFGIGPLKRLVCEDGHLRLRYWEKNDTAKGKPVAVTPSNLVPVHPDEKVRTDRDTFTCDERKILLSAGRDGSIVMIDHCFDRIKGVVIEGHVTVREHRGRIETHQHAAAAGLYLEGSPGRDCAIIPDSLGTTRTGSIAYADHRITGCDIYADAGKGLVLDRSGKLQGICSFACEDTVGPLGYASYCGVRHGKNHSFRLIARGDFFEFYIDDYYVQTYRMPNPFSGRIGLMAFDGTCVFEDIHAWDLNL